MFYFHHRLCFKTAGPTGIFCNWPSESSMIHVQDERLSGNETELLTIRLGTRVETIFPNFCTYQTGYEGGTMYSSLGNILSVSRNIISLLRNIFSILRNIFSAFSISENFLGFYERFLMFCETFLVFYERFLVFCEAFLVFYETFFVLISHRSSMILRKRNSSLWSRNSFIYDATTWEESSLHDSIMPVSTDASHMHLWDISCSI